MLLSDPFPRETNLTVRATLIFQNALTGRRPLAASREVVILGFRILAIALLIGISPPIGWAQTTYEHDWSQSFGVLSGEKYGESVAVTESHEIWMTGTFTGAIDFGGGTLMDAGSGDVFLAKFDAAGNHIWSQRYGDSDFQYSWGVATDEIGCVVAVGQYSGTIDFGGGPLPSAGNTDIFIAKFDSNGNHLWSHNFGDISEQRAWAVAIDQNRNIITTGWIQGTVDFGGGPLAVSAVSSAFLAKFGPDGNHLWSDHYGISDQNEGRRVAVDQAGNVIVTGRTQGQIDFGGGVMTTAGGYDAFLTKFNPDGAYLWSRQFGDPGGQNGMDVATDLLGNVIATGEFQGTVDFGGGPLSAGAASDMYVAKFNPTGGHIWSKNFADFIIPLALTVDELGSVVLTGQQFGDADFGGGPLPGLDGSDSFLVELDSSGNHVWSTLLGTGSAEYGTDVAFQGDANIVLLGQFTGSTNLGGEDMTGTGNPDIFLAKFGPPAAPSFSAIRDVPDDQGGFVRIEFACSGRDSEGSSTPIVQYEVFRRIDSLNRQTTARLHDHRAGRPQMTVDLPRLSSSAASLTGWDYVGAVPAHGESHYNVVVPTLVDSTLNEGTQWSVFFVRAATNDPFVYFDSPPDSGYSQDNLAPKEPALFTGVYVGGTATLDWLPNTELDFAEYRLYRGTVPDFVPGAGNLLSVQSYTGYIDVAEQLYYYKLSAVDVHGNESSFAFVQPSVTVGVEPDPHLPARLALHASVPNPLRDHAVIRFDLPIATAMGLTIYDTQGRIRRLAIGQRESPAGRHEWTWDGCDDRGVRLPAGVYFISLETPVESMTRKAVLIE
jgi:hypothetical protein